MRLVLFGSLNLLSADGTAVLPVLRQPRRLCLLAVCAVDGRRGFVSRDRLLELLWPEVSADHARLRLRQALYFLRHHLGEILELNGRAGVRCRPGAVESDVDQFDRCVDEGNPAEALRFYAGEFMQAFHVDGASESVTRWIDDTRGRYRQAAIEATFNAASRTWRAGRFDDSIALLEQAARLEPTNEDVARRIVQELDRMGGSTAAIRAYQAFARRLRDEIGVEPSPELSNLAERLLRSAPRFSLSREDEAAIRRVIDLWFQAATNGRWDLALKLAVEDAVFCPPDSPVLRGVAAIQRYHEERPGADRLDYSIDTVRGSGDIAWVQGHIALTGDAYGTGETHTLRTAFSSGVVRTEDGTWRLFHGAWTVVDGGRVP